MTSIADIFAHCAPAQVPILVILWFHPARLAPLLAAITFIVAAVTDWADGYLARKVPACMHACMHGPPLGHLLDSILHAAAWLLTLAPSLLVHAQEAHGMAPGSRLDTVSAGSAPPGLLCCPRASVGKRGARVSLHAQLRVTTQFGAFLDPVADKLMACTALVLLSVSPPEPLSAKDVAIPAVIMIGRELTMSALREWAAAAGGGAAHKASACFRRRCMRLTGANANGRGASRCATGGQPYIVAKIGAVHADFRCKTITASRPITE